MNKLAPDSGHNRLSIRTLLNKHDTSRFISNESWRKVVQSELGKSLAESILAREKHFSFSATEDKDLTSFVQVDAIVLTTQEYLELCAQMYKKGYDDGSNAWPR